MLLSGINRTRDDKPTELHARDLYFAFDNMIVYNQSAVLKCFQDDDGNQLAKATNKIHVNYDEESLRARRGLVRPGTFFEQVEMMTIISKEDFTTQMPFTKRTHYPGTNLGNKIGDVVLDSLDSLWKLKVEDKIVLHGRFRIDCGGKTKGEVDPPGRGVKRKSMKDEEPVFFHARPIMFYDCLQKTYHLKAVIDLCVADGKFATHCARHRIPYAGFAVSEEHAKLVRARCLQQLMECSYTEGAGDRWPTEWAGGLWGRGDKFASGGAPLERMVACDAKFARGGAPVERTGKVPYKNVQRPAACAADPRPRPRLGPISKPD